VKISRGRSRSLGPTTTNDQIINDFLKIKKIVSCPLQESNLRSLPYKGIAVPLGQKGWRKKMHLKIQCNKIISSAGFEPATFRLKVECCCQRKRAELRGLEKIEISTKTTLAGVRTLATALKARDPNH
jgi:hypothetical protein